MCDSTSVLKICHSVPITTNPIQLSVPMSALTHLIYASTATRRFDRLQLSALLQKAREANVKTAVTGMLLHEAGNFFQVLEGPKAVVECLFIEICSDKRHDKAVKIMQEPIAKRSFEDWTMAFSDITRDELTTIEGLNDFFGRGSMFAQLGSGRAKKLVAAFGQGRWRSKIAPHSVSIAAHADPCIPA